MSGGKKYNYPESLPLLKFFWHAEAIRKNPIPFHRQFFNRYGDTFSVRLGRKKWLMLSRDKEVVEHILRKNHKNYYKSKIQTNFLSKYLGHGLLTINGEYWLQQRRLIQPAFHKEKMAQLVSLMQETIEKELSNLPIEKEVDVFPIMNRLAFKVVATSLFNVSASEETLARLQYIIQEVQEFLVKEVRLPHKGWWFRLSGQVKKHLALSEESRTILQEIIEERRRSRETHNDLLDMLLATRYEDTGEPMTDKQLIDEITILFVAGHETTANALSFTSWLLARHPEVQQEVFSEIDKVNHENNTLINHIGKLQYTKSVIDESMRLYPPAWITDRENLVDDDLAGFHIRKDTLVGISFYELHRHPDYWDQPNEFIPERFLGEAKKKTTGHYYPFGAGPRMCIGMGFAIYELVLAISYLVNNYELSTSVRQVEMNPLITLKPVSAQLSFRRR
ncbi:MAG: cytochrome P450 [Bacteroidia bacterium]|nr:cytochrome P450 [Bacteroidia bacterium]NNM23668.1 cytochrome P450 [Flavobacteriaceae bacterium]